MRRFSTSQNCLHKSINFYKLSDSLNVCDFAINIIYLQFIYVQYVTAQSQTKRCPVQRWVDFRAKVSFNTVDLRPTIFLHKHFITPALSQWFNLLYSKIQCIQYNCTIHIDTYWTKIIVLTLKYSRLREKLILLQNCHIFFVDTYGLWSNGNECGDLFL